MDKYLSRKRKKEDEEAAAAAVVPAGTSNLPPSNLTSHRQNSSNSDISEAGPSQSTKENNSSNANIGKSEAKLPSSFKAWQKTHEWLGLKDGKAICYICTEAVEKKLFPIIDGRVKSSVSAFVKDGYSCWKNASKRFQNHEKCELHHQAFLAVRSLGEKPIVAHISDAERREMANSRIALEKIFDTVNVLAQQGTAFRSDENDKNSCLMKILRMRAQDVPQLDWWLGKSGYKWLHHDSINEILEILSNAVLNQLLDEIKAAECFSVIMDETADISRKEQVSISFRITTSDFEIKEIFAGFYHTPNTKSATLLKIIEDVLLRYNLQFCNLRGQCYDGAAAMSGKISGLQKRVREIEPRALYVHCTAHSLNLVAQDAMKNISVVNNFVGVSKDLINFVRDSPKRMEAFKDIQLQCSEKASSTTNLSPFCPTRWCMRVKSLKTIVSNYETILSFLEKMKAETTDDSGKADGFLKYLEGFEFYFLALCTIKVLERIEVLNTELQRNDLSINESHEKVKLVLDAMLKMRESGFDTLWEKATAGAKDLNLEEPRLPRTRRAPKRLENATVHNFTVPEDYYRKIYFETVDQVISSLNNRFQSETIEFLNSCENYIIGKETESAVISDFYRDDFNPSTLQLHRDMFVDVVRQRNLQVKNLRDVTAVLKNDQPLAKLLPELSKLVRLLLTIPASSCTAERSFSALRRLKTYLRTTMVQSRLNSIAILHVHQDIAEHLDLSKHVNTFISKNNTRLSHFGETT